MEREEEKPIEKLKVLDPVFPTEDYEKLTETEKFNLPYEEKLKEINGDTGKED